MPPDKTDHDTLHAALSMYGEVEPDRRVDVVVRDEPGAVAGAIKSAHRHGYVVDKTEDATDDVRPVKRRIRLKPVDEADVFGAIAEAEPDVEPLDD